MLIPPSVGNTGCGFLYSPYIAGMRYLEETFEEGHPAIGTYGGFRSEMTWLNHGEGVPCILWLEDSWVQPRDNNPRIKFCVDKNQKTSGENPLVERIPMMICDEPHIPEGFEHIKHNLEDSELDYLKEWVRKNKELLLDLGEGKISIIQFCEKSRKGECHANG